MPALRRRSLASRRLAWWLWLALLLPLAQGVAAAHVLSHASAERSEEGGKALHSASCDLCLAAAAIAGGAPPGEPPSLRFAVAPHVAPVMSSVGVASSTPARAYLSRGPPFASL
jgi:hypothetical protein